MGIKSVAIYSEADRYSNHVNIADQAVAIGGSYPSESYLSSEKILEVAQQTGAQAIIPGYGFLSENVNFVECCEKHGLVFIGPTAEQMKQLGLKHAARKIAEDAGIPIIPGTGLLANVDEAISESKRLGYPLMLKSTGGGGGIGLVHCENEEELISAFESTRRLVKNFFKENEVFLERYVKDGRHIEVQIIGDGLGNVLALGERDCSLQRRHQKVVEETPAPNLQSTTREKMLNAAVKLAKFAKYRSVGTVEFLYDSSNDQFYFLEVNTRLQVEHAITEMVTGVDLVEWMILVACDKWRMPREPIISKGASIEVRLYAENPIKKFQPSAGILTEVRFPDNIRVDTWVETGTEISTYYDPMLAKLIVYGTDRDDALTKLHVALDNTSVAGIVTNLDYLRAITKASFFRTGKVTTDILSTFSYSSTIIEVIKPGNYTTVQDYPGRIGYWDVGVPPSGPMDHYAFRIANRIVGNSPLAAALEFTLIGPKLRFYSKTIIGITGPNSHATLDGIAIKPWIPVEVSPGQILEFGNVETGCRGYLAVRNGLDVPLYLGSRSTFVMGQFGGHAGRQLCASDMIAISQPDLAACTTPPPLFDPLPTPLPLIPTYSDHWEIGVLYGPHGAPDFFQQTYINTFFTTDWKVHYHSDRVGIRLMGPKPIWTRSDGGEGGLHPSNIHDCEYAIGTINFTGDTPIILALDGPSLGGFVCPATIIQAEIWKIGQLKSGDKVRFRCLNFNTALNLEMAMDRAIENFEDKIEAQESPLSSYTNSECILAKLPSAITCPEVVYRQAGDKYILIEYGPNVLDFKLRLRVHSLMEALNKNTISGIIELSPGVRSLQIHYDGRTIHQKELVQILLKIEAELPSVEQIVVPSRIVHMPLAFEDKGSYEAINRYRSSVRNTAPWLPSNIEFIRRINGLKDQNDVKKIVFETSYIVFGLGDV
ncbi:unnamed protein product, partial [Didymodactylos carnosus]